MKGIGRDDMMRIGSLCSGAGGLDMAVEYVFGAKVVWHCEIDAAASKALAHRWPGVPNHHDLITTDWAAVEPVDIVCAGWPCQPFSLAGKRKGAEDERAIWPHIAGAVRVLRPRIIVLENVTAVFRVEFGRVADSLAALGYDLRWTCLRASQIGAPHQRERLFVVAHASGDGRHEGWPESAGFIGRPDAAVSGDGPVNLLPTPNASDGSGGGQHPDRRGGHSQQLCDYALLLATPSAADGGGGHVNRSGDREMATGWGKYAPAIARWETATRPAPAPTEPNKNGNPRLSARFSEWMLGWPDGWVTQVDGISRNDQLRIIGNGVVPQQAAAALRWLLNLNWKGETTWTKISPPNRRSSSPGLLSGAITAPST